jgi:hypothetical protein
MGLRESPDAAGAEPCSMSAAALRGFAVTRCDPFCDREPQRSARRASRARTPWTAAVRSSPRPRPWRHDRRSWKCPEAESSPDRGRSTHEGMARRHPMVTMTGVDREARRRPRGAGGERSGRVGGSPASLSSRQGALHASGRSSLGGYPQCPTVVKRTRHEVREFSKLADIELSPARAPRHEIHRQLGRACDRFRGFCNAHAAE